MTDATNKMYYQEEATQVLNLNDESRRSQNSERSALMKLNQEANTACGLNQKVNDLESNAARTAIQHREELCKVYNELTKTDASGKGAIEDMRNLETISRQRAEGLQIQLRTLTHDNRDLTTKMNVKDVEMDSLVEHAKLLAERLTKLEAQQDSSLSSGAKSAFTPEPTMTMPSPNVSLRSAPTAEPPLLTHTGAWNDDFIRREANDSRVFGPRVTIPVGAERPPTLPTKREPAESTLPPEIQAEFEKHRVQMADQYAIMDRLIKTSSQNNANHASNGANGGGNDGNGHPRGGGVTNAMATDSDKKSRDKERKREKERQRRRQRSGGRTWRRW